MDYLVGYKTEWLEVLRFIPGTMQKRGRWECRCKCGNLVYRKPYEIYARKPISCGCYEQKRHGNVKYHDYHTKHGYANKHPLYKTWKNMKQRCYNPNNQDFKTYGGNGVGLCAEWKDNAGAFINWALKAKWTPGLSIDRMNPDADYSPDNCRFLTPSENSKRVRHRIGSDRPNTKLTEAMVIEIRNKCRNGIKNNILAKEYNVKQNVIYQIKKYKTWKHVP